MDERVKQFTRMPCDTDDSWPEFVRFRDQSPPRRLLAGKAGMDQVRKWYVEHDWKSRVAAYDAWLDEVMLERKQEFAKQAARDVSVEHMMVLKDLRETVMNEARKFLELSKNDMPMIQNVGQLVKAVDTTVKLDRLIRGEVTERTGDEFDYSKLTPEELLALQNLLTKAKSEP